MNLVLLRNRPHFGAQITSLPVLYFFFLHHGKQEPLTLLSKSNVSWVYQQLPWIEECIHSNSKIEEIKKLCSCDNLLNLRPSNRLPVMLHKILGKGKLFDLVKNDSLARLTSNTHNVLCTSEYRASAYLKIFIKDEQALLEHLSAPFLSLIKDSKLETKKAELNILIMPGGGAGEIKKWGIENFVSSSKSIAQSLNKSCHINVLLGPDEKDEIVFMEKLIRSDNRFSLYINIPIKDIAKLVDECDLTIANDCGPSHIAQCMQKPYIGLFREPNTEWFLYHPKSIKILPQEGQGIKTIQPQAVIDRAVTLLKSKV